MGKETEIAWCDSTINPVMGCDGCELWTANGSVRACYAGTLHARYGSGRSSGYAFDFLKPETFPGRMAAAARWSDLTGKPRPEKSWLSGRPRHVFISDMGDALSRGVPFEFLRTEVIDIAARWPHVGMWLTKQPQRMREFGAWLSDLGVAWPASLWAGASLTDPRHQGDRVGNLRLVPATTRFLSIEPILSDPGTLQLDGVDLVIVGGESGPGARTCDVGWVRSVLAQCRAAGVAAFCKQLGSNVRWDGFQGGYLDGPSNCWPRGTKTEEVNHGRRVRLRDRKGGDPAEWPEDLRVREMPAGVGRS